MKALEIKIHDCKKQAEKLKFLRQLGLIDKKLKNKNDKKNNGMRLRKINTSFKKYF